MAETEPPNPLREFMNDGPLRSNPTTELPPRKKQRIVRTDQEAFKDRLLRVAWRARNFTYKYDKITSEQIRLIILNPAEDSGESIRVEMVTVPVASLGIYKYEALSYHWGELIAERPVFISSQHEQSKVGRGHAPEAVRLSRLQLYVHDNLYRALKNLRLRDRKVLLWADALCINQEDTKEKEAQVALMAKIYSKAHRVCVWLGDRDRHSDQAMGFISRVVKAHDLDELIVDHEAENWNDLLFLMMRSWFSRRWVIQELGLARDATVHCGTMTVHWMDFVDAISLFNLNFGNIRRLRGFGDSSSESQDRALSLTSLGATILVEQLSNIFPRKADGTLLEPTKSLEYLVSTLTAFQTSDPRDTIYAFLSLAAETSRVSASQQARVVSIEPKYDRDLLEVYVHYTSWVISNSKSLDIICRRWALPERQKATVGYYRLTTLPSWIKTIPQTQYDRRFDEIDDAEVKDENLFVGTPGSRRYNASFNLHPEVRFGMEVESTRASSDESTNSASAPITPNFNLKTLRRLDQQTSDARLSMFLDDMHPRDRSLYVKGYVLGTVVWNTQPIEDGIIPGVALQKFGWSEDPFAEGEYSNVPDPLWRTLVADRGPDGNPPPSLYHRACLRCLVHHAVNGHINTRVILERRPPAIVKEYVQRVQAVTRNRVLFEGKAARDRDETIGIGPPQTAKGDVICILFGCSVPCVLRQKKLAADDPALIPGTRPEYYEFVGEAFVYGKMDGQAITGLTVEELERRTQEFRLL
ncbi:hypothetical protein JX265_004775 [Neoarthrinium moseri]|uniref:Heterokaryon incompatibility domain-containing protein n=1 Tax=Neoarthrinium moseri TaxID=1658444 RepID=A0A9Q0ANC7_9PEZI|nr:hypothetical protein JX265_004775 [Neoarthrinium moseri]